MVLDSTYERQIRQNLRAARNRDRYPTTEMQCGEFGGIFVNALADDDIDTPGISVYLTPAVREFYADDDIEVDHGTDDYPESLLADNGGELTSLHDELVSLILYELDLNPDEQPAFVLHKEYDDGGVTYRADLRSLE